MKHKILLLMVLVFLSLNAIMIPMVAQDDVAMIEPDAGTWHTWLLEAGSEMRLDAPPDEAATQAELEELHALLNSVDDDMRSQIRHWSAGVPAYQWNKLATEEFFYRGTPSPISTYGLALMNVAIYDATIAAWDTKYTYMRPRPSTLDNTLNAVLPTPHSPAYPSEHAVAAGAASTVLAHLFPDKADFFVAQGEAAAEAMLHSGIYYPSDIEAGFTLGQAVGEQAIAWAQANPINLTPVEAINGEDGKWSGTNPIGANLGSSPTFVLSSPDEFRPEAPLEFSSAELEAEMQELRDLERTPRTMAIARYWEYGSGAFQNTLRWTQEASNLIWEYGLEDNAPRGALVYAAINIAGYDATIATFEAKYYYLAIRPIHYDTEFQSVFPTPNHPTYPSAHSSISTAILATLAALFPEDADSLMGITHQIGDARMWAGLHFRNDIVAGETLGQQIAEKVLSPFDNIR
jgi:membrane-associated phospholipid phosphatase